MWGFVVVVALLVTAAKASVVKDASQASSQTRGQDSSLGDIQVSPRQVVFSDVEEYMVSAPAVVVVEWQCASRPQLTPNDVVMEVSHPALVSFSQAASSSNGHNTIRFFLKYHPQRTALTSLPPRHGSSSIAEATLHATVHVANITSVLIAINASSVPGSYGFPSLAPYPSFVPVGVYERWRQPISFVNPSRFQEVSIARMECLGSPQVQLSLLSNYKLPVAPYNHSGIVAVVSFSSTVPTTVSGHVAITLENGATFRLWYGIEVRGPTPKHLPLGVISAGAAVLSYPVVLANPSSSQLSVHDAFITGLYPAGAESNFGEETVLAIGPDSIPRETPPAPCVALTPVFNVNIAPHQSATVAYLVVNAEHCLQAALRASTAPRVMIPEQNAINPLGGEIIVITRSPAHGSQPALPLVRHSFLFYGHVTTGQMDWGTNVTTLGHDAPIPLAVGGGSFDVGVPGLVLDSQGADSVEVYIRHSFKGGIEFAGITSTVPWLSLMPSGNGKSGGKPPPSKCSTGTSISIGRWKVNAAKLPRRSDVPQGDDVRVPIIVGGINVTFRSTSAASERSAPCDAGASLASSGCSSSSSAVPQGEFAGARNHNGVRADTSLMSVIVPVSVTVCPIFVTLREKPFSDKSAFPMKKLPIEPARVLDRETSRALPYVHPAAREALSRVEWRAERFTFGVIPVPTKDTAPKVDMEKVQGDWRNALPIEYTSLRQLPLTIHNPHNFTVFICDIPISEIPISAVLGTVVRQEPRPKKVRMSMNSLKQLPQSVQYADDCLTSLPPGGSLEIDLEVALAQPLQVYAMADEQLRGDVTFHAMIPHPYKLGVFIPTVLKYPFSYATLSGRLTLGPETPLRLSWAHRHQSAPPTNEPLAIWRDVTVNSTLTVPVLLESVMVARVDDGHQGMPHEAFRSSVLQSIIAPGHSGPVLQVAFFPSAAMHLRRKPLELDTAQTNQISANRGVILPYSSHAAPPLTVRDVEELIRAVPGSLPESRTFELGSEPLLSRGLMSLSEEEMNAYMEEVSAVASAKVEAELRVTFADALHVLPLEAEGCVQSFVEGRVVSFGAVPLPTSSTLPSAPPEHDARSPPTSQLAEQYVVIYNPGPHYVKLQLMLWHQVVTENGEPLSAQRQQMLRDAEHAVYQLALSRGEPCHFIDPSVWVSPSLAFSIAPNATQPIVVPPQASVRLGPIVYNLAASRGAERDEADDNILVIRNNVSFFDFVRVTAKAGRPQLHVEGKPGKGPLQALHFNVTTAMVQKWLPRAAGFPSVVDIIQHALRGSAGLPDVAHAPGAAIALEALNNVVVRGQYLPDGSLSPHIASNPTRSRQSVYFAKVLTLVNRGAFPINVTSIGINGVPCGHQDLFELTVLPCISPHTPLWQHPFSSPSAQGLLYGVSQSISLPFLVLQPNQSYPIRLIVEPSFLFEVIEATLYIEQSTATTQKTRSDGKGSLPATSASSAVQYLHMPITVAFPPEAVRDLKNMRVHTFAEGVTRFLMILLLVCVVVAVTPPVVKHVARIAAELAATPPEPVAAVATGPSKVVPPTRVTPLPPVQHAKPAVQVAAQPQENKKGKGKASAQPQPPKERTKARVASRQPQPASAGAAATAGVETPPVTNTPPGNVAAAGSFPSQPASGSSTTGTPPPEAPLSPPSEPLRAESGLGASGATSLDHVARLVEAEEKRRAELTEEEAAAAKALQDALLSVPTPKEPARETADSEVRTVAEPPKATETEEQRATHEVQSATTDAASVVAKVDLAEPGVGAAKTIPEATQQEVVPPAQAPAPDTHPPVDEKRPVASAAVVESPPCGVSLPTDESHAKGPQEQLPLSAAADSSQTAIQDAAERNNQPSVLPAKRPECPLAISPPEPEELHPTPKRTSPSLALPHPKAASTPPRQTRGAIPRAPVAVSEEEAPAQMEPRPVHMPAPIGALDEASPLPQDPPRPAEEIDTLLRFTAESIGGNSDEDFDVPLQQLLNSLIFTRTTNVNDQISDFANIPLAAAHAASLQPSSPALHGSSSIGGQVVGGHHATTANWGLAPPVAAGEEPKHEEDSRWGRAAGPAQSTGTSSLFGELFR